MTESTTFPIYRYDKITFERAKASSVRTLPRQRDKDVVNLSRLNYSSKLFKFHDVEERRPGGGIIEVTSGRRDRCLQKNDELSTRRDAKHSEKPRRRSGVRLALHSRSSLYTHIVYHRGYGGRRADGALSTSPIRFSGCAACASFSANAFGVSGACDGADRFYD